MLGCFLDYEWSYIFHVQVLLDDFSNSQGYKLLYSYLLYLEATPAPEAGDALRNLVLLIQNLIMDGFHTLEIPSGMNFGGPFQNPDFVVPTPNNQGEKWYFKCMWLPFTMYYLI